MRRRAERSQSLVDIGEAELREQVRLLRIENEAMRNLIQENGFPNPFQSLPNENPQKAPPKRQRIRHPALQPPTIPITPGSPRTAQRGCTCKGNCSTRNCGCVKKNIGCTAFCKCGEALCVNQTNDADKENVQAPNKESASEPSNNLLNRVQKAKQRSIFSPDGENSQNNRELIDNTTPLPFGEDSEAEAEAVEEARGNKKPRAAKKDKKTAEATKATGRSRMQKLEVPQETRKLRSLSNKETVSDKEVAKKTVKKRSVSADSRNSRGISKERSIKTLAGLINPPPKPGQKKNTTKRGVQRILSDRSTGDEAGKKDKSQPNKNVKKAPAIKKSGKNKEEEKETINSQKQDDLNNRENVVDLNELSAPGHSRQNDAMEVEKNAETNSRATTFRTYDEDSSDSEEESNNMAYENNQPIVKTEIHSDGFQVNRNLEEDLSSEDDEVFNHSNADESFTLDDSEQSKNSYDGESSSNLPIDLTHPTNNINFEDETSENFNPMKPRRQLSRSPLGVHQQRRYVPALDRSERPLPVPIQEEEIPEPPPEEINEPVVDWDKHKAELVHCRKCKRTFYRHRIKVHEQSCKKI